MGNFGLKSLEEKIPLKILKGNCEKTPMCQKAGKDFCGNGL